jgi:sulfonate transport system substrate-binding protein
MMVSIIMMVAVEAAAEDLTVRFGSTSNLGILPLIAKHEGIFKSRGLEVDYKKLQTGKITMDALLSGEIDIGTLVDSNIAFINFSKNPLKVIASLATRLDDAIWFNTASDVSKPSDLIKKRIGYVPATTSHVFLARFLRTNGISWSEITPVLLQPPAMEAALRNGAVDAVSIWQPWGTNIRTALGSTVKSFQNSSELYPSKIVLATTDVILNEKPAVISKVIESLTQASETFKKNPRSTYQYLSTEIGVSLIDLPDVLRHFEPGLGPASRAAPLVKEIGSWIKETQRDFIDLPLPHYDEAFNDQLH